jgi:hypothetical protein
VLGLIMSGLKFCVYVIFIMMTNVNYDLSEPLCCFMSEKQLVADICAVKHRTYLASKLNNFWK